jgi:hypothetical protein
MIYFVTYFAMDTDLGSNPLWHAGLAASKCYSENQKIEVKHAWGFYSMPMTAPQSIFENIKVSIKKCFGIKFDIQGNHGKLIPEEMRHFDKGFGLRGVTFEITEQQYAQLKKLCDERLAIEDKAIQDAIQSLKDKKTITDDAKDDGSVSYKVYKYDSFSFKIYQEELRLAAIEKREPRLKPFEFKVSLTDEGRISLEGSYTCKNDAIGMLRQIGIAEADLAQLTTNELSRALPRIGGNLERFFLHSAGPLHEFRNENKLSFFRKWEDKQDKLYWSLPPQRLITSSKPLKALFTLADKYTVPIKRLLRQLQTLERVVVNAPLEKEYEHLRRRFVEHVCKLYESFAFINSKMKAETIESKIADAKRLIHTLNFTINDRWDDKKDIETVVTLLPNEVQKQICKIIGCSYFPCDVLLASDESIRESDDDEEFHSVEEGDVVAEKKSLSM